PRQPPVPDGVHTSMDDVQTPHLQPPGDSSIADANLHQLRVADHAILLGRHPRQLCLHPSKAGFATNSDVNPAFDAPRGLLDVSGGGLRVRGVGHPSSVPCDVRHVTTHRLRVFGENAGHMSNDTQALETGQAAREAHGGHPYGRYFEEFEVGDVYKHWPAKT